MRTDKARQCDQRDKNTWYGFTLLEVLVALAVAAIGLAAVSKSMTLNVDVTAQLKERTIATWVASNRMAELRMERQFSSAGGSSGRVEMAGITWELGGKVYVYRRSQHCQGGH